jgi:redox-sensitive bicupin YhaK (pirin superfamily)
MSTEPVAGKECQSIGAPGLTFEAYPNRETHLGSLPIARAMPIRDRRMVGPWCFLDRFGPLSFAAGKPMNVPPHPHIGLQTVSWLLEGEVLHSDSLGSEAIVRPGGVNVMTAGSGIAHSEETPARHSGRLNGVQLWVALLDVHRNRQPAFTSLEQVPVLEARGGLLRVFAGEVGGVRSPAPYFSPILGLEVQVHPGETLEVQLEPSFEHALLALEGDCAFENQPLQERTLYYLGSQRQGISLDSRAGGRALLIGGPPFPETILMWWNFVARTPDEIAAVRADWEARRRFPDVPGEHGPRLAAPELVRFARPNPAS